MACPILRANYQQLSRREQFLAQGTFFPQKGGLFVDADGLDHGSQEVE
jgi:hypothetical protein